MYEHTNMPKLGSVLHPAYEKGSQHLPKAQPTNDTKTHTVPQLKSVKGKQEEDYVDNL